MQAMTLQEVISFVRAALECSVFVSPNDPGLTYEELIEIGKRADLQQGELGDAIPRATTVYFGKKRLMPDENTTRSWADFMFPEEPDFRNYDALDFVLTEFNQVIRAEGAANARLERSVLIERAITKNISRHDIEVAVTTLILSGLLVEKDTMITRPHGLYSPLPSQQRGTTPGIQRTRSNRERIFSLVKDIVERRDDSRRRQVEPLDAFTEALTDLGYSSFRLWWTQVLGELRRTDAQSCSVAIAVLAAALIEGALTFVVRHAQSLGLGVMGSKTFQGDPRSWKIDDLVSSAASGRDSAILDDPTRRRVDRVVRMRQRIHAGRMLSDFPNGPHDLRPDEAREARETADIVVRATLDWLGRYPIPKQ